MDPKEHDHKIQNFLINMGLASSPEFVYSPNAENFRHLIVEYLGVKAVVILDRQWIMIVVYFAYAPKTNVAPFFRRLLVLNSILFSASFAINDQTSQIQIMTSRHLDGLEPVEFRQMLEAACRAYLDYGIKLVQEFQLPQQPG